MMKAYLLGALVFVVAIVIFIAQNDAPVSVQFINWKTSEISLAIVMLISVCAGALITFLLDSYRAFKTGQKLRKLVKLNQTYEDEIKLLKGKLKPQKEKTASDTNSTEPTPQEKR